MDEVDEKLRKLVRASRLLATPIDFARLVSDGALKRKGKGNWWRVIDFDRLPPTTRHRIAKIKFEKGGSDVLVQFNKATKNAAKLYEKLSGRKLAPEKKKLGPRKRAYAGTTKLHVLSDGRPQVHGCE